MNTEFIVTDLGLQLNGRMLLPGTRLVVKNEPHPSWLDVGHVSGMVAEQRLVVASPAPVEPVADMPPRSELEADYEAATGKKPHHKMKDETLYAAIKEALDK